MQQLDLLHIRKQPAPREPEIPARVIKAYVKQNMRDFNRRQAERERLRREARKREKPRTKRPKPEDHPNMRSIKVTYRAVFRQPIGRLNPFEVKLSGDFPVEVYGAGEKWQAREIQTAARNVYKKLQHFTGPIHGMKEVEQNFQERLEPWQIWGKPHNENTERMLLPGEICDLGQGRMGWLDPEDFTHILHGPMIDPTSRIPNAACGAKLNAKCFISTKANVEPTCKKCAEVWKREYRGK
jgi:hypothetical protein